MAANKKKAEPESQDAPKSDGKGKLKAMIIVGVLMVGEGAAIFALISVFSAPPESTVAAEDQKALEDPLNLEDQTEIELCDVDAFNRKEGRLYVYSMQLSALVSTEDVDKIERFIEARTASIKDRVQMVIRSADPKQLNDPSLETVKRQLKFELNNLIGGKELIQDVLISKLLQSRTNL
jgi:flagellar basal body-associated protein FliL